MKLRKLKIQNVIKGDATLRSSYYDYNGNYCVIGGLLHEAGYPMGRLEDVRSSGVDHLPVSALKVLRDIYGIGVRLAKRLMETNDQNPDLKLRRKRLIELVKKQ